MSLLNTPHLLYSICLEWNALGMLDNAFTIFCEGVASNNILQALDLRNNQISHDSAAELCRALKQNNTIRAIGKLSYTCSWCFYKIWNRRTASAFWCVITRRIWCVPLEVSKKYVSSFSGRYSILNICSFFITTLHLSWEHSWRMYMYLILLFIVLYTAIYSSFDYELLFGFYVFRPKMEQCWFIGW